MATRDEIFEIVKLIKNLPNSPITTREALEETVTLFSAVLGDLPCDMVRAATIQYLSEGNPFFPTPGVLREKAMDLQMLAAGLPTAGEAWGMVLTGMQHVEPSFCATGARLRNGYINQQSLRLLHEYTDHLGYCDVCDLGGYREKYGHPAVAETVRLLGGRDVILTDNPTADRARFIEAYREIVKKEKMKLGMVPQVQAFVENNRPMLAENPIKQLSARLTK